MARRPAIPAELSALEARIMEVLWRAGEATADDVRRELTRGRGKHELTDSSVRTLLRRLEVKGYATHRRDGKRFVFEALVKRPNAAAAAARRIVETICGGSARSLLIGLLETEMLTAEELDEAREILRRKKKDDGR